LSDSVEFGVLYPGNLYWGYKVDSVKQETRKKHHFDSYHLWRHRCRGALASSRSNKGMVDRTIGASGTPSCHTVFSSATPLPISVSPAEYCWSDHTWLLCPTPRVSSRWILSGRDGTTATRNPHRSDPADTAAVRRRLRGGRRSHLGTGWWIFEPAGGRGERWTRWSNMGTGSRHIVIAPHILTR